MNMPFIEWVDSSSLLSSQVGIQVSLNQEKLQFACVERGLVSKIISAIANIFGISTYYGIHLLPHTSKSILLESSDLKAEGIQEKVLPEIRKFLDTQHTPITEESANRILDDIIKTICRATFLAQPLPKGARNKPAELQEPEAATKGKPVTLQGDVESLHSSLSTLVSPPIPIEGSFEPKSASKDDLIIKKKNRPHVKELRSKDDMDTPSEESHFDIEAWKKRKVSLSLGTFVSAQDLEGSATLKEPSSISPSPENTQPPILKGRVKKASSKEKSKIGRFLLMSGLLLAGGLGRGIFHCQETPDFQIRSDELSLQARHVFDSSIDSSYEGELDGMGSPSSDYGVLKDKKGNIIREGKWRAGVLVDGFGTLLLDEGSLFVGPIRDGAPCGRGIKKSIVGEEEYIVNGYGRLTLENGEIFIGDIEAHLPSGYGEVRSKEGGLVKEGVFHGSTLVKEIRNLPLPNSEMFRGEVNEEGQPHGFGAVFSEKGMFFGKFDHGNLIGERPKEKNTEMLLFSSYTSDRGKFNKGVIDNHKTYSEERGYHYVEFLENLAKDLEALSTQSEDTTLPYWSKIAGMLRLLNLLDPQKIPEKYRKHLPKEFVWLDDDAVMTKRSVKMEDVVRYYAPEDSENHIFLTQDIQRSRGYDLNTALLFVRNSAESRSVFSEIWSRRFKKADRGTYGNCPDQSCLHEQAALQDLVKLKGYDAQKHVRIIPQRDPQDPVGGWGINTFHRKSHMDDERHIYLDYDAEDSNEGRWKEGDFIGQATGMAKKGRLDGEYEEMNLRELYMQQLVESEEAWLLVKAKKVFLKIFGY